MLQGEVPWSVPRIMHDKCTTRHVATCFYHHQKILVLLLLDSCRHDVSVALFGTSILIRGDLQDVEERKTLRRNNHNNTPQHNTTEHSRRAKGG